MLHLKTVPHFLHVRQINDVYNLVEYNDNYSDKLERFMVV